MRYLVTARVKEGRQTDLQDAIDARTLGQGSVAGGEYQRNMRAARELDDGRICWVETCYCPTPLLEERPYWEEYFDLTRVQDAHDRRKCRDISGEEPWACSTCDCTDKLEARLQERGKAFLESLKQRAGDD